MNERELAKQIKRLKVLDFYPKGEGEGELLRALWDAAYSDEHAVRVIDRCLTIRFGENGRSCPTPAEVREIAEQVPVQLGALAADPACDKCRGTGDLIREKDGYSFWSRCPCVARKPEPVTPGRRADA
jgi:hypothetical protein